MAKKNEKSLLSTKVNSDDFGNFGKSIENEDKSGGKNKRRISLLLTSEDEKIIYEIRSYFLLKNQKILNLTDTIRFVLNEFHKTISK